MRRLISLALAVAVAASTVRAETPSSPEPAREIMRLFKEGKGAEATKLAHEALKAAEARHGPDHLEVANILIMLGGMQMSQDMLERAIEIREKRLGPDSPLIAEALVLLVKVRGLGPDSEKLLTRALAIMEKVRGAQHAEVGRILMLLHGYYTIAGWKEEAAALAPRLAEFEAQSKPK